METCGTTASSWLCCVVGLVAGASDSRQVSRGLVGKAAVVAVLGKVKVLA